MTLCKRIQVKSRFVRLPQETVFVGKGSLWNNPYKEGEDGTKEECYEKYIKHDFYVATEDGRAYAKIHLKGKDLACLCSPDELCHADKLLQIANNYEKNE